MRTRAVELTPLLSAVVGYLPIRVDDSRPATSKLTGSVLADSASVPGYYEPGEVVATEFVTIEVDERGIIRSVTADYRIRAGTTGDAILSASQCTIERLGSVLVAEPEWRATANERVPTATASLTDDRRSVRLEAGNRLEANSCITLFSADRDAKFIVHLAEPLEPGTPAFFSTSPPAATFSEGAIARGSPPTDTAARRLTDSHDLAAFRRDTRYFDRIDVG